MKLSICAIIIASIAILLSGCVSEDVIRAYDTENTSSINNYIYENVQYQQDATAYRESYNIYGGGNNTVYYQNTAEAPIHVSVSLHDTVAGRHMLAYTADSDRIPDVLVAATTSSGTNPAQLNFIVLPGHYYMAGSYIGTQIIDSWIEWS